MTNKYPARSAYHGKSYKDLANDQKHIENNRRLQKNIDLCKMKENKEDVE